METLGEAELFDFHRETAQSAAVQEFRGRTELPAYPLVLLPFDRNPPRHVQMETAEIIHVARALQHHADYALCRDRSVPILVSRVAVSTMKLALAHSIASPPWAVTCVGSNFSLSIAR